MAKVTKSSISGHLGYRGGNAAEYYSKTQINELLDEYIEKPEVSGAYGQVLTSDGAGGQSWADAKQTIYVLESSVSAIVYDPNALEGERLSPSTLTLTAYKIVNGVRSAYGAKQIAWSCVTNSYDPPWESGGAKNADVMMNNPVYSYTFALPGEMDGSSIFTATMSGPSGVLTSITVPVVVSGVNGSGLTDEAKEALLACFAHVAWIDENGQSYYDALREEIYNTTWQITNSLTHCTTSNEAASVTKGGAYSATITPSVGYVITGATVSITMGGNDITATAYSNGVISIPAVTGALVITISAAAKTVSSISAVYTQSGTVYDTDDLDSLKQDLVVTATYSDSSTEVIPAADYTLSGTLEVGTNTITVSYGGKTDTFTVTATEKWSYSITDLTKLTGAFSSGSLADCGMILSVGSSTDPYRRSFAVGYGETSVAIASSSQVSPSQQTSDYYPIKIPAGATSFDVSITPNTQFVQVLARQLNDGVYSTLSSSGWSGYQQGGGTKTLAVPADDNAYIFVTTKYNSAGTSYPTEPTGIEIVFHDGGEH